MTFENKVVIVTGGGNGIGAAITRLFLAQSATVVTVQRSQCDMPGVHHIETDLSVPANCQPVIDETIERFGRLDILVNNAGMMTEQTIETMALEEWERTMALNLTAPFLLSKYAITHLIASGGNIVNIGSIEGIGSNPQHTAYCASKAGLHAMTKSIAVDYGTQGVRCNAVAPGWIDTELNLRFIESMAKPEEFKQKIGGIHPLGRTGKPEEVATLVCWLASEQASFITGQIMVADGGRLAKLSLPT